MKRQIPEQRRFLSCNPQDDKRQPDQDTQPDQKAPHTIAKQGRIDDFLIGYHVRNTSSAAPIVASMILSSCTMERNPASNCDGARYTPFSSIFWKNFPNRALSACLTVLQSTG